MICDLLLTVSLALATVVVVAMRTAAPTATPAVVVATEAVAAAVVTAAVVVVATAAAAAVLEVLVVTACQTLARVSSSKTGVSAENLIGFPPCPTAKILTIV
jgi:hypothetical protein